MNAYNLRRKQLDSYFDKVKFSKLIIKNDEGWIRTIRKCLNMTLAQLGSRVGLADSNVRRIEVGETTGSITLKTFEKFAEALDCDLRVLLIPKRTMDEFISEKAIEKASKAIEANNQSMCLENQGLSDESMDNQIQHLAKKLIESNSKDIWND